MSSFCEFPIFWDSIDSISVYWRLTGLATGDLIIYIITFIMIYLLLIAYLGFFLDDIDTLLQEWRCFFIDSWIFYVWYVFAVTVCCYSFSYMILGLAPHIEMYDGDMLGFLIQAIKDFGWFGIWQLLIKFSFVHKKIACNSLIILAFYTYVYAFYRHYWVLPFGLTPSILWLILWIVVLVYSFTFTTWRTRRWLDFFKNPIALGAIVAIIWLLFNF